MARPVNIRVTNAIPFPALVVGGAPVKITKTNGIWTVALDVHDLATSVPLTTAYATDYVIVWDDVAGTFAKVSLAALGLGGALLQRSATATPIVVAANDQIINYNINSAVTTALPGYASRKGVPLTFKDAGGHQSVVNTLTITPAAGETIDGQASLVLSNPRQRITLTPYNDGTNAGWST